MTVDFINNSSQRTPCVLVLDASWSMKEKTTTGRTRIDELNAGIEELERALKSDDAAISRVQLCVVIVGGPGGSAELMLDWKRVIELTNLAEQNRQVEIFTIGVEGANLSVLSEISSRPAIQLAGMKFKELFLWLSDSLSAVSRSRPGEKANLPDTDPWKNVGI